MKRKLEKNFRYFLDNLEELVKKYNNKYIVLKDEEVVADFDTEKEAYYFANKKYEPGSYLILPCHPGRDSYTQTFHSRVVF